MILWICEGQHDYWFYHKISSDGSNLYDRLEDALTDNYLEIYDI